jgi:hypothetical protein
MDAVSRWRSAVAGIRPSSILWHPGTGSTRSHPRKMRSSSEKQIIRFSVPPGSHAHVAGLTVIARTNRVAPPEGQEIIFASCGCRLHLGVDATKSYKPSNGRRRWRQDFRYIALDILPIFPYSQNTVDISTTCCFAVETESRRVGSAQNASRNRRGRATADDGGGSSVSSRAPHASRRGHARTTTAPSALCNYENSHGRLL